MTNVLHFPAKDADSIPVQVDPTMESGTWKIGRLTENLGQHLARGGSLSGSPIILHFRAALAAIRAGLHEPHIKGPDHVPTASAHLHFLRQGQVCKRCLAEEYLEEMEKFLTTHRRLNP